MSPAIPRVRDFRGLNPQGFDGRGNYSLGIREQIIFPEIDYDKVENITGLNITVCTTARNDAEGKALLAHLGMPFSQQEKLSPSIPITIRYTPSILSSITHDSLFDETMEEMQS